MAAAESEIAARLIERLLADPAFRDRFRRDPAVACREAGLDSLAEEMRLGAGKAMYTLDIRESRSSLAGVMMAAAMEGMGVYEFSQHVVPHLEDISGAVGDVLSRVNLPALPGGGALAGSPAVSASAAAHADAATDGAAARGGGGAAAANGAAPASAGNGGAAPVADATAGADAKAAAAGPDAKPEGAGPDAKAGGAGAAKAGDAAASPEAAAAAGGGAGAAAAGGTAAASPEAAAAGVAERGDKQHGLGRFGDADGKSGGTRSPAGGGPQGSELPRGDFEPKPAVGAAEPDRHAAGAAQPAATAPEAVGARRPIDPAQFGQEGSGGPPDAEALALLHNKNVVLDGDGIADIKAGRIDPRIVGVLTKLSHEHKIVVSCMCSDHPRFTTGGSVSNHTYGRGMDIASIDGEIVSPGSALAREVASELSQLDPRIRPSEIGSPFAISGPAYFTDAAHQNHIHVGFDQAITPEWNPPPELAAAGQAPAGGQPPAGAAAGGAPAVDAAPVAPAGGGGSTLGAAALRIAQSQRGVHEIGSSNTGPQVDRYLEAAGVAPGNPWCASFITWSLQQAGHKMPGGGWAAVATWVRNAEQNANGLRVVSAEEARPGDIVAYDWGGGTDFSSDGHIGFLDSTVKDGRFTALEGNNADAVNVVPRELGGGPNVVFIRAGGDAPAGVVAPAAAVAAVPAAGVAQPAAAPEAAVFGKREPNRASGLFAAAAPGKTAGAEPPAPAPKPGHDSNLFLQAVEKQQQQQQPAAAAQAPAAPADAIDLTGAPAGYPGDDAPKSQIAAWMASEAKKRGLPAQLPIMASLVESNLTNVHYGDADSVGYFQMRVGIWNQGAYAGYPDNPELQLKWFLDTAERVKAQRIANGQSTTDPHQFGEWIADVERPATQYRYRYQLKLADADNLLRQAPQTPAPPPAAAAPEQAAQGGADQLAAPPVEPPAPHRPIDPAQYGLDGKGGPPDAEAQALLHNKNVVLDADGIADIKAGRIDPRIVAVVTKLSHEHKIVVSCICSDHPRMTTSGFVSNHTYGRGLDIASIDGEIVSPGSTLAREVASELSTLPAGIRPDEIGSPFAINGPGYFTDAAHQNHIHVGFKTAITPDFRLPGDVQAGVVAPVAPAAAVAAVPAAGVAQPAAAPEAAVFGKREPNRASGLFAAAAPGKTAGAEPPAPAPKPGHDSNLFLQAVEKQQQQQQPAAAAQAPAAPADAIDLTGAPAGYPGDDAPKSQIAAWMASEAKKRGLPAQLPIMASLVESNLTNVHYGDADSVGYFQMRVGIWNQGAYAGYPDNPELQLKWFLDTAERVKAQRIANGQSTTDPHQFGEWIADVERPATQYRYRYQLKLADADNLLRQAPQTPAPPPAAAAPEQAAQGGADQLADAAPPALASRAGPRALDALKEAEKYTGTPYRWGGSTPQTGFDCSGLVQWSYAQAGIQIPRVTDQQITALSGTPVRRSELLPGDLVFFRDSTGYVHHVGISMGGDKFLHAPHTGDVVKVSSLDEPYYRAQFTGGRRFDPAVGAGAGPGAAAPLAPAAAAQPADPVAVAAAQAAVARDAAEARQRNSGLFRAINAQEARNHEAAVARGERAVAAVSPDEAAAAERLRSGDSALFLRAVTAEEAAKAKAAAQAAAAPATPPVAPVPPADPAASAPPADPSAPAGPAAPEAVAAQPAGPPPDLSAVPADYPGDNAGQEALARWLAKRADKAGLPPELPVMAALVESGVRNVHFGDADSVGFFQMRVGFWNHGPYAGYPDNPELQAKWFIDNALAVKRQRIAAGDASFGKDPSKWGEWIADVERPAAQYRGRYQLRLAEARRLLG